MIHVSIGIVAVPVDRHEWRTRPPGLGYRNFRPLQARPSGCRQPEQQPRRLLSTKIGKAIFGSALSTALTSWTGHRPLFALPARSIKPAPASSP